MSSAIKSSLIKLDQAVKKLESAVEQKKIAAKNGPQADLFAAITGGSKTASNANSSLNVKMLATRLDSAINQVEQILKEGRG